MIRCLLFGHAPNESFEFARYAGLHSMTYCERCGETVTRPIPADKPVPPGHVTREQIERDNLKMLADVLDERYAKRRRRRSKPSSDSSKSGVLGGAQ